MEQTELSIEDGQLNLNYSQLGNAVCQRIYCLKDANKIQRLLLNGNNISPIGVFAFSKTKWNSLQCLELDGNKIGNLGCKYLSWATFNNLKYLNLSDNCIEATGMRHLSKAIWPSIEQLFLSSNQFGVGGVNDLVKARWDKLCQIFLINCQLTDADALYLLLQYQAMNSIYLTGGHSNLTKKQKLKDCTKKKAPNCKLQLSNE